MDLQHKIIDLTGLKKFLTELKSWVKSYFDSRIDKDFSSESANPLANSTVTNRLSKAQWSGKKDQVQAAIASGDVIPGFTQVTLIDDEESQLIECTMQDIYDLFGLVYMG